MRVSYAPIGLRKHRSGDTAGITCSMNPRIGSRFGVRGLHRGTVKQVAGAGFELSWPILERYRSQVRKSTVIKPRVFLRMRREIDIEKG